MTLSVKDKFLSSFDTGNHMVLDGTNIIPYAESGLLFNVAGMSALLPFFLRQKTPLYKNAISAQQCIRLNDLDCIGDDSHLSGFVMLGLFSFGFYTKKQAIYAIWNFLISCVDAEKLTITVHRDDKETFDIWSNIVDTGRISLGYSDNFWSYAANGPCGRCTEVFYQDEHHKEPLEIANIVFMEYLRQDGKITQCDSLFIDVGIGLERLEGIVHKSDNVFALPVLHTTKLLIQSYVDDVKHQRIICDHVRTLSWMFKNNVFPGNKRRESICRKLVRRILALLEAYTLDDILKIISSCFAQYDIVCHDIFTMEYQGIKRNELDYVEDNVLENKFDITSLNLRTTLLSSVSSTNSSIKYITSKFFVPDNTVLYPEKSFRDCSKGSYKINDHIVNIDKIVQVNEAILHFCDTSFLNDSSIIDIYRDNDQHVSLETNLNIVRQLSDTISDIKEYFASSNHIRISLYDSSNLLNYLIDTNIPSYLYDKYSDGKREDFYFYTNQRALRELMNDNVMTFKIKNELNVSINELYSFVHRCQQEKKIYAKQKAKLIAQLVKMHVLYSANCILQDFVIFDDLEINDMLIATKDCMKYGKNALIFGTSCVMAFFINESYKNIWEQYLQNNHFDHSMSIRANCWLYAIQDISRYNTMLKYLKIK